MKLPYAIFFSKRKKLSKRGTADTHTFIIWKATSRRVNITHLFESQIRGISSSFFRASMANITGFSEKRRRNNVPRVLCYNRRRSSSSSRQRSDIILTVRSTCTISSCLVVSLSCCCCSLLFLLSGTALLDLAIWPAHFVVSVPNICISRRRPTDSSRFDWCPVVRFFNLARALFFFFSSSSILCRQAEATLSLVSHDGFALESVGHVSPSPFTRAVAFCCLLDIIFSSKSFFAPNTEVFVLPFLLLLLLLSEL